MVRMSKQTGQRPDDIVAAAAQFFGPGGVGLLVSHRAPDHISLEGAGGFVTVSVEGHGSETEVTAVSREWESDVQRFLASL
jgi:hypothetical protein